MSTLTKTDIASETALQELEKQAKAMQNSQSVTKEDLIRFDMLSMAAFGKVYSDACDKQINGAVQILKAQEPQLFEDTTSLIRAHNIALQVIYEKLPKTSIHSDRQIEGTIENIKRRHNYAQTIYLNGAQRVPAEVDRDLAARER